MTKAIDSVILERVRQERLKDSGKFQHTCADPEMTDAERSLVLLEEVGEVARALLDAEGAAALREELVQVAAVAVAWIEAIDDAGGES